MTIQQQPSQAEQWCFLQFISDSFATLQIGRGWKNGVNKFSASQNTSCFRPISKATSMTQQSCLWRNNSQKVAFSFILPLHRLSLTNTWMLHKNKQKTPKTTENNPLLCAAHQLWKQKLKSGILVRPCRELLERTAIKFDAEHTVLHQKLPSKQLVLLMTTLDSERSLTQLIVLYNFQDVFMFLLTFFPHFKLKDELDWWPRFSLIKSTAGCSRGQRGKKSYRGIIIAWRRGDDGNWWRGSRGHLW